MSDKISPRAPNPEAGLTDGLLGDSVQARGTLGLYLKYASIPFFIGFVAILFVIATDSMRRATNPEALGVPLAKYVQSPDFLAHAGLEIGLAFLIAGIVSVFVDATARRAQTNLLGEAIQLIGNEVFQGVYKIYHDPNYVKAVIATCLAVAHVRKGYEVDCEVSEFTPEELEEWGIESTSLVKVDAEVTYFSENIASRDAEFPGRYFIPRGFGSAGNCARLTYLEVGDKKYETAEELEALELASDHPEHTDSERGYQFPIPAKVRQPTKVHLRATFAKEKSDNEIFTFLKPTIGAKIKFRFNIPGLTIGVTARTATGMNRAVEILPGRSVYWEVPQGALLPNNHVTVWWQTAQASGASTDSSGLTALMSTAVGDEREIDERFDQVMAALDAQPPGRLRRLFKRATGPFLRLGRRGRDTPP